MADPKKKKKKSWKKNLAKAAVGLGLGYAAFKGLGKKRPKVEDVMATENINIGTRPGIFPPRKRKWDIPHDKVFGNGIGIAKGGRVGAKHGGRTSKQFGGGLNRRVARPVGGVGGIGGVGAPVRPMAYKHGGKVKSMGIAKRGGGVAKK